MLLIGDVSATGFLSSCVVAIEEKNPARRGLIFLFLPNSLLLSVRGENRFFGVSVFPPSY